MAGMPAMEDNKPGGKGVDLAVIMGGGKPKLGGGKLGADDDGGSEKPSGDDSLPPGFESAFAELFPDMADDKDKMMAMKRLIGTCMGGDDY